MEMEEVKCKESGGGKTEEAEKGRGKGNARLWQFYLQRILYRN